MKKPITALMLLAVVIAVVLIFAAVYERKGIETANETADTHITELSISLYTDPIGIALDNITFCWNMESTSMGRQQSAYEIYVSDSEEELTKRKLTPRNLVWDSGKVEGDSSLYIQYEGETLDNAKKYWWTVKVWDEEGNEWIPSSPASFVTAVSEESWDDVSWISAPLKAYGDVVETEGFAVEFTFQTESSQACFVFGAENDEYGKLYIWQIDATGDSLIYRLLFKDENETIYQEEKELCISSELSNEQEMKARIVAQDGKLITYLNDELVAESDVESCLLGGYGFYQGRTYLRTWFDDFMLWDSTGEIIASENFSDVNETIFSPTYANVQNGRLCVSHEYLLTNVQETPSPMFRREFEINKAVDSAYLFATALGIYEPYLNGEKIGDSYFSSGRQSYIEKLQYDSYDVTDQLVLGKNVLGAYLGHGWFDRAGYDGDGSLALCAQLVINYADGTSEIIATDDTWECYMDGPIRRDDMYKGELYDASKEVTDWCSVGCSAQGWEAVLCNQAAQRYQELPFSPKVTESIKCIYTLTPVSLSEPIPGVFVYDFGEEFSGFVSLEGINEDLGMCVTVRYGEALNTEELENADDAAGTIWTDNLLMAQNADYFISDGNIDSYAPTLVCRAFRYVQITGISEALPAEQVTGVVLSSDLKATGSFETSSDSLNKLYETICNTQSSNYLDVPTDCPQRDERYGWTGDAQVYARSASYNSLTYHFMEQYLEYIREGQGENGAYPEIAPSFPENAAYSHNGWGDAGITITWYQYLQYGDKQVILDNYEAMCRYISHLIATSDGYIRSDENGYGDHNAIVESPKEITSTALCAYVSKLLSQMADAIGLEDDADKYYDIYEKYRKAWQDAFVNEDGSLDCWTQTVYTLGLAFGLFGDGMETLAANKLASCIDYSDYHLNTGYIGTQFLLPVLVDCGMTDAAYAVLEQDTYPSWLYMIDNGAAALYERWNGYEELSDEGYILQGSLNHCGLGSVNEFFFRYILGIETDENVPGYKLFYLQPTVGGSLTFA